LAQYSKTIPGIASGYLASKLDPAWKKPFSDATLSAPFTEPVIGARVLACAILFFVAIIMVYVSRYYA
jgi:hypothetical protein